MDLNMLMQMLLGGKGKQKNGMNPQMLAQMFGMGGHSFGGFGGTGAGAAAGQGGSGNPAAAAVKGDITDTDVAVGKGTGDMLG